MRAPNYPSNEPTPREYQEFQRLAQESSDEFYGWMAVILIILMMGVAL